MGYRETMRIIQAGNALVATLAIGVIAADQANAQQGQQQGPTVEQRIGYEIGPMIVRAAVLSAQLDEARAIITARDKTIADLQVQINQLRGAPEAK